MKPRPAPYEPCDRESKPPHCLLNTVMSAAPQNKEKNEAQGFGSVLGSDAGQNEHRFQAHTLRYSLHSAQLLRSSVQISLLGQLLSFQAVGLFLLLLLAKSCHFSRGLDYFNPKDADCSRKALRCRQRWVPAWGDLSLSASQPTVTSSCVKSALAPGAQ